MATRSRRLRYATLGIAALAATAFVAPASAGPDLAEDWLARTKQARYGLLEAIEKGRKTAGGGVPYQIELEVDRGRLVYSFDAAEGTHTRNVVLDATTREVVEDETDSDDHSAVVAAQGKVGLAEAVAAAAATVEGKPFYAQLQLRDQAPAVRVLLVRPDGRVERLRVDGTTGAVAIDGPGGRPEPEFTDEFPEAKSDLGPTGRNRYVVLEPGHYWVLEGKEGGKTLRVTYTVLAETKTIDGVECRAVEAREELDGKTKEVTKDYHAISKRTGNVYYFGEDVDVYEDGKVVSHEGAWLSGKDGARFGLFVPAIPLLGSRYYQEIAPDLAMDRAEIVSLTEVVETPAGRFQDVLRYDETTPLEPGSMDSKYFSPDVGFLVKEEGLLLVKHGTK